MLRRPSLRGLLRERQGWSEKDFDSKVDQIVLEARLAGLLHDVGHAPFSHTGEATLFKGDKRHEFYSVEIIKSSELGIGEIIDDLKEEWGVSREGVVQILDKQGIYEVGFVRDLIDSVWDVDKMDYLLRDSLHCGVQYGRYDLERIIDTITLYDEAPDGVLRLGIEYGGIHAIEGFILARYFMFTQVYYHKVRRAYDLILTDFILELLNDALKSNHYPEGLEAYLQWNDWRVLAELTRRMDQSEKNLAWRLATRQHPKSVYETGDHADPLVVNRAIYLRPRLEQQFSGVRIWTDRATDHPERFRTGDRNWPIERNGLWQSLTSLSKALAGLDEIRQFRVYADVRGDDQLEEEMVAFCRREMS